MVLSRAAGQIDPTSAAADFGDQVDFAVAPTLSLRAQRSDLAAEIAAAPAAPHNDGVTATLPPARTGSCWSIAAHSRGGDIGSSRMRTPIVLLIALATASIGGNDRHLAGTIQLTQATGTQIG